MKDKLYATDMEKAIILIIDLHWEEDQKVEQRLARCGISAADSKMGKNKMK